MKYVTIQELMELAARAKNASECSTHWIELETIGDKTFAIVAAIDCPYIDKKPHVMAKVAYNNSYMKDYDIDWIMPWDEKTGDVWDTETTLESEQAAAWLINQARDIIEWYKTNNPA